MGYLVVLLIGLAVIIFLINVKNFDGFLHRIVYFAISFIVIVVIIVLVQPKEYIIYNSNSDLKKNSSITKKNVSQTQYLALKMKAEGYSEEQIVESYFHESDGKLDVAKELELANFSLETIRKFFTNYKSSGILENRKLTKEEYLRYLVEQDIKRFATVSSENKAKIREMEKNKISISKIKESFPNYIPNDEVKAIELGKTGKSLREIKIVFPNYEPQK